MLILNFKKSRLTTEEKINGCISPQVQVLFAGSREANVPKIKILSQYGHFNYFWMEFEHR
jgi:hypothetical protein